MSFVAGLEISSYVAFIILVIALAVRFSRYAALPTPLRWEIYPVPHEEKEKAERGSSYYENLEWWRAKLARWLAGELKDTLKEMLFMVRLFYYNRKMWWGSYLFHGGIYLILAWFVLLFIGAITELAGLPISVGIYPFNEISHNW
ncbi:MAG: hypothetical protein B6V02_00600 [Thermoprotei archaeon ex4572_64]|nr:MAG: hypothetical protein B6V02_00600 [Thermoprotei archaeon ex4572_64]